MRKRMIKMLYIASSCLLSLGLYSSCAREDTLTESQHVQEQFTSMIDGEVDPAHYWKGAVKLHVRVETNAATDVYAFSGSGSVTYLYDKKTIKKSGTVDMTVPQGFANDMVRLVTVCGDKRAEQTIYLNGTLEQTVNMTTTRACTRVTDVLYGASILKGATVKDIPMNIWEKVMTYNKPGYERVMAENWLPRPALNYELQYHGKFQITFLSGYENCQNPHVLGYYYHTAGTYSDMTLVPISETHMFDFIDTFPKVQYQLNNTTWVPSNFDMHDNRYSSSTSEEGRNNDDYYNIVDAYEYYRSSFTGMRGITFEISIPEEKLSGDMRIGFYLSQQIPCNHFPEPLFSNHAATQRSHLSKLGFNTSALPEFAANFSSTMLMPDGQYRSFCHKIADADFLIMGLEDIYVGGDYDCNDVVFGITADGGVLPEIVDEGINDPTPPKPVEPEISIDYDEPFPWTIAYEDLARNADFDFNDAVIQVIPNFETHTAEVYVCAAGSTENMYLHFEGPGGDELICEVHEALGGGLKPINTTSGSANVPAKLVATVPWPEDYTMQDDANRFYIAVQRGDCQDCSDVITLNDYPGMMPEALCVPGEWNWPREGIDITQAYYYFPPWSSDVANQEYWDWYDYISSSSTVTPNRY